MAFIQKLEIKLLYRIRSCTLFWIPVPVLCNRLLSSILQQITSNPSIYLNSSRRYLSSITFGARRNITMPAGRHIFYLYCRNITPAPSTFHFHNSTCSLLLKMQISAVKLSNKSVPNLAGRGSFFRQMAEIKFSFFFEGDATRLAALTPWATGGRRFNIFLALIAAGRLMVHVNTKLSGLWVLFTSHSFPWSYNEKKSFYHCDTTLGVYYFYVSLAELLLYWTHRDHLLGNIKVELWRSGCDVFNS